MRYNYISKRKLIFIAIFFCIVILVVGVYSDKTEVIELPNEMNIISKINEDTYIGLDRSLQSIYSYDKEHSQSNKLITSNSNQYIRTISNNSEWVVWIESDYLDLTAKIKPSRWAIKAKNIKNNTEILIDENNFESDEYGIASFKSYIPDYIDISDENMLVYEKLELVDGKLVNKINLFDLDKENIYTIKKIEDIDDRYIQGVSIDENIVVWAEAFDYDESATLTTQYKFSEIYYYDIKSKETTIIRELDYLSNPVIRNKIIYAMSVINTGEVSRSDIVAIDVLSGNITNVTNETTNIYENNIAYKYDLKILKDVSEGYLGWNSSIKNNFIYDIKKEDFRNILPESLKGAKVLQLNCILNGSVIVTIQEIDEKIGQYEIIY